MSEEPSTSPREPNYTKMIFYLLVGIVVVVVAANIFVAGGLLYIGNYLSKTYNTSSQPLVDAASTAQDDAKSFPTSQKLNSATFLAAINGADGDLVDIVRQLLKKDYLPDPIRDEFETSAHFQSRLDNFDRRPNYGPGFMALTHVADFAYDADTGTVTFFYGIDGVHEPERILASDRDVNLLEFDNLEILPVGEAPPTVMTRTLSPAQAQALLHHKLRLAIIVSLNGLKPPVLGSSLGGSDLKDLLGNLDGNALINNSDKWDESLHSFMRTDFTLKAHVIRIIVFDLDNGGSEHPIAEWNSADKAALQKADPYQQCVITETESGTIRQLIEDHCAPVSRPAAKPDVAGDALPTLVGQCGETTVAGVDTRLQDTPGSGSMIRFSNGGGQVSYDQIDGIDNSRPGDQVRICLVSIPDHCPPGDNRGKVYHAINFRTGFEWDAPDAEHSCGGA